MNAIREDPQREQVTTASSRLFPLFPITAIFQPPARLLRLLWLLLTSRHKDEISPGNDELLRRTTAAFTFTGIPDVLSCDTLRLPESGFAIQITAAAEGGRCVVPPRRPLSAFYAIFVHRLATFS